MPYIKSVCVHADVKSSIAYILNPEKTENTLYTASLNCLTNAEDAYLNMKFVYENYSHRRYNEPPPLTGKGWVKAIHYIQSFDPKDNISPKLAHKIAKAFALKTFGEDCQIVIATHEKFLSAHRANTNGSELGSAVILAKDNGCFI